MVKETETPSYTYFRLYLTVRSFFILFFSARFPFDEQSQHSNRTTNSLRVCCGKIPTLESNSYALHSLCVTNSETFLIPLLSSSIVFIKTVIPVGKTTLLVEADGGEPAGIVSVELKLLRTSFAVNLGSPLKEMHYP